MWQRNDIDMKLSILDMIKDSVKDKNIEEWRPTDKTVEEQVEPYSNKVYKTKIDLLSKQLQNVDSNLNVNTISTVFFVKTFNVRFIYYLFQPLMAKIDEYREKYAKHIKQKKCITEEIEKRLENTEITDQKFNELQKIAYELLKEKN